MPDQPYCQFCMQTDRLEVLAHRREADPAVVVESQSETSVIPGREEAVVDYRCGCGWSGTVGVSDAYRPPAAV